MRILVTGADGFIGRHVVAALRAAGHTVIAGMRWQSGPDSIDCDYSRDILPGAWIPRLAGIDVVINAVGILRGTGANTFARVHVSGPKALFEACHRLGVQLVIQISALGSPAAGEYLVSKLRGDVELAHLDLDWTILRPSLVYSIRGSYGGTSLLRAMAAPAVFAASTVDLVLGVLALIGWRPAVAAGLMCASLLVYTVFIGVVFPSLWFEPFEGLLKNLPLIPAVLVMGVLSRRR